MLRLAPAAQDGGSGAASFADLGLLVILCGLVVVLVAAVLHEITHRRGGPRRR